ncbi:MAG: hypothetical protein DCF22_13870 [Leptolyngbya sp.]|nr:MAG: hypothetical protein DCF22_13870 [Leptolyngbya sp.]
MTAINIDRLTLKLSGLSQDQGQQLVRLIAEGLASHEISSHSARDTPNLQLNITAQPNANVDWLANQIVSEVLRQLNSTLA